jgi:hypothetical protein
MTPEKLARLIDQACVIARALYGHEPADRLGFRRIVAESVMERLRTLEKG